MIQEYLKYLQEKDQWDSKKSTKANLANDYLHQSRHRGFKDKHNQRAVKIAAKSTGASTANFPKTQKGWEKQTPQWQELPINDRYHKRNKGRNVAMKHGGPIIARRPKGHTLIIKGRKRKE